MFGEEVEHLDNTVFHDQSEGLRNQRKRRRYHRRIENPFSVSSRFHTENKVYLYNLNPSLAYYANENFDKFIPEKDIKDQILKEKPVSANTDPVRTIDS